MVILKFYVINTSDNLPFQPYYSGLYIISNQKMHITSLVQFMSKKSSRTGPCSDTSNDKTGQFLTQN